MVVPDLGVMAVRPVAGALEAHDELSVPSVPVLEPRLPMEQWRNRAADCGPKARVTEHRKVGLVHPRPLPRDIEVVGVPAPRLGALLQVRQRTRDGLDVVLHDTEIDCCQEETAEQGRIAVDTTGMVDLDNQGLVALGTDGGYHLGS